MLCLDKKLFEIYVSRVKFNIWIVCLFDNKKSQIKGVQFSMTLRYMN